MLLCVGAYFWLGSRYPELNIKASMSGSIKPTDSINYNEYIKVNTADPLYKQITFSAINWMNTNKRGMMFGVVFAAIILALMRNLSSKHTPGSMKATVFGVLIGSPLGVCVNCAAPIAKGLYVSGSKAETALAALFSSPTLNIIVLTMAFTLFPLHMAVTKLIFTLLVIFILVPVLAKKTIGKNPYRRDDIIDADMECLRTKEPWSGAIPGSVVDLAKSLFFIIKTTVPLMFVAGFLGAALAYILPFDAIATGEVTIFGAIIIAAVGLFLPVPMALDMILAQSLMIAGMPMTYVMILMFTLGMYSVYALSIVWTTMNKKTAIALFLVIMVFGLLAGFSTNTYEKWQYNKAMALYDNTIIKLEKTPNTK